jgi:hypothetical protein
MPVPAILDLRHEHHCYECCCWQLSNCQISDCGRGRSICSYHRKEDESVIIAEASRDAGPCENAESDDSYYEPVENAVDYNDAVSSGLRVDVVRRRPTLQGLDGDIHRAVLIGKVRSDDTKGLDLGGRALRLHMYDVDKTCKLMRIEKI